MVEWQCPRCGVWDISRRNLAASVDAHMLECEGPE